MVKHQSDGCVCSVVQHWGLKICLCCLLLYSTVYSEVRLTQQSPLGLPCSGEEVILQCTLQGTTVIWSFPGGDETLVPSSSEQVSGNFRAQPVGVVNGNFTSTLTFPAENETVVTCFNELRSRNASLTVTAQGISVLILVPTWYGKALDAAVHCSLRLNYPTLFYIYTSVMFACSVWNKSASGRLPAHLHTMF